MPRGLRDWANLVIDTRTGDLVLIDTDRMISTHKLAQLHATGQPFDIRRRRIHALLLRRLMYLDAKYLDTTRAELMRDPVYTRYLNFLIAYSKQFDLVSELVSAVERLRVKNAHEPENGRSVRSEEAPRVWRVTD